ncbi:MAG: hypothetical protein R3C44_16490 [Chloroflexota bacterium]
MRDEHNARRKSESEPEANAETEQTGDASIVGTPLTTYVAMRGLQGVRAQSLAHAMAVDYWDGELSLGVGASDMEAAISILTLLEQVVGVTIDWPLRQVSWFNYLGDEVETGVRQLTLGNEGRPTCWQPTEH